MEDARSFIDRNGVRWSVSEIRPAQDVAPLRERRQFPRMAKRGSSKLSELETRSLALPWLRFESRGDSRSVEPAPADWRTLSDEELEDLLSRSRRHAGR